VRLPPYLGSGAGLIVPPTATSTRWCEPCPKRDACSQPSVWLPVLVGVKLCTNVGQERQNRAVEMPAE
jgi:hypothetical protein